MLYSFLSESGVLDISLLALGTGIIRFVNLRAAAPREATRS